MLRKAFSLLLFAAVPGVLVGPGSIRERSVLLRPTRLLCEAIVRTDVGTILATTRARSRARSSTTGSSSASIRDLYDTGNFETITLTCDVNGEPSTHARSSRSTSSSGRCSRAVQIRGVSRHLRAARSAISPTCRSRGQSIRPPVSRAIFKIDSTYEKAGYYLARVRAESTVVSEGNVGITFIVEEGRRLALSGLRVTGNKHVPDERHRRRHEDAARRVLVLPER